MKHRGLPEKWMRFQIKCILIRILWSCVYLFVLLKYEMRGGGLTSTSWMLFTAYADILQSSVFLWPMFRLSHPEGRLFVLWNTYYLQGWSTRKIVLFRFENISTAAELMAENEALRRAVENARKDDAEVSQLLARVEKGEAEGSLLRSEVTHLQQWFWL